MQTTEHDDRDLHGLVRKARTYGRPRKRVYVRCGCGHKCYGTKFGYVESYADGDAWMAFRRHFERSHGRYPFSRSVA